MDRFSFACPSCGRILVIPASLVGKSGTCNYCRERIVVDPARCRVATVDEQLAGLAAELNKARSIGELFDSSMLFLSKGLNLCVADKAVLFIRDKDASGLRLERTRGSFSAEFLRDEAFVPLGSCLCGRAAASGEVLVCLNCFRDSRHDRMWVGMQTHGHYIIPLRHNGVVRGVLALYTQAETDSEKQILQLLKSAGEIIGHALHRISNQ